MCHMRGSLELVLFVVLLLHRCDDCYGWTQQQQQQERSLISVTTTTLSKSITLFPSRSTQQRQKQISHSCYSNGTNDINSYQNSIMKQISYDSNITRRTIISSTVGVLSCSMIQNPNLVLAVVTEDVRMIEQEQQQRQEDASSSSLPVQVSLSGDTLKLFNEGRTYERQGNIMAAQRLYGKVTQIAPRYIYGWSNLGNTQVILNSDLNDAEKSYNTAIHLCQESIEQQQQQLPDGNTFGIKRCSDLYVLLLNRGCLRLNTGQYRMALRDLQQAEQLRGQPDPIILQNLARAYEYNGNYQQADYDYTLAISMSNSNEVNPFWLRSAMVMFQLGSIQSGYDLLKRVLNRFPDAPEVRAAYAVFLLERNPNNAMTADVQQTFLDIPTRQRLKYSDREYINKTICWPPAMVERLNTIIKAVGDDKRSA